MQHDATVHTTAFTVNTVPLLHHNLVVEQYRILLLQLQSKRYQRDV
jgi:hypothetical protein